MKKILTRSSDPKIYKPNYFNYRPYKPYYKRYLNFENLYCVNCGNSGHSFKHCHEAITSYGIILLNINLPENLNKKLLENLQKNPNSKLNIISIQNINLNNYGINIENPSDLELFCNYKNSVKFLFIMRRHTVGFIEFIRGRYQLNGNPESISPDLIYLFQQMTPDEISRIKISSFDELWEHVWADNKNKPIYQEDYTRSKIKFEKLKNFLPSCFEKINPLFNSPEWGFPKGRRVPHEDDLATAIREFTEESDYKQTDFLLLKNIEPIIESLIGTDGIDYKHIYYTAITTTDKQPEMVKDNLNQKREIGDIGFYTIDEAIKLIRPYHTERRKILIQLYTYVMNHIINLAKLI